MTSLQQTTSCLSYLINRTTEVVATGFMLFFAVELAASWINSNVLLYLCWTFNDALNEVKKNKNANMGASMHHVRTVSERLQLT